MTATLQGEAAPVEAGQIQVTRFLNPAGLEARGENLFGETAASGAPQTGIAGVDGAGSIRQGSLEGSNVSTVQELVDMIETQRAYEVNAKVIKAADEMAQYVTQNVWGRRGEQRDARVPARKNTLTRSAKRPGRLSRKRGGAVARPRTAAAAGLCR